MSAPAGGGAGLWWRIGWRIAGLIALVFLANITSVWLLDQLTFEVGPRNEHIIHRIIMTSVVLYALLIALPFVPGMEIGVALIIMAGPGIAGLVYLATVAGLFLSFLVGHFVPQSWLRSALKFLLLEKASRLIGALERLSIEERLRFLVSRAPSRIIPFLLRHRYIAAAVLLNLPGNALIGGGGGISMLAGMSKLYSLPAYLVTLILAVAPVPFAVLIFGAEFLS